MPIKRPIRRRRKPATPRWWTGRRLTAYGKQAVSVLVLVGTLFLRDQQVLTPAPKRDEDEPHGWMVDVTPQRERTLSTSAEPIPPKPFRSQMKPPCSGVEVYVINGGCWGLTGHAPCPPSVYTHAGRCYLPKQVDQRPPTSIEP